MPDPCNSGCESVLFKESHAKWKDKIQVSFYILFKWIDALYNPKMQQLWAFPLYYLIQTVLMMSFLSLSRLFKQRIQSRQKTLSWKLNWKRTEESGYQLSVFKEAPNWHVFRNGSSKGGPVPWQGFKPRGMGESLQEGSRSSSNHSGQYWFGVSPCLQTGLQGMESHSQLLQKALDQNQ